MSLKIPTCLVPGTASESRGRTTTYSLSSSNLNTPDPLGVVATAASTSPDPITATATQPCLATVSLVSSPSPAPQPSVELTWAPTGSEPRILDSDKSGLALFDEILEQQETGTKTTEEGQGEEELRSFWLEELTDETLAQEALNQATNTTSSGTVSNTPVTFKTMGDLDTPAILFDNDASDYFDIKRETLAPGNNDTTNSNDGCPDSGDKVIAELDLPVTSGENFSSLWDTQVEDLLMEEAPAAPKMEVQHEPSMKEQIEAHAASAGFAPNPMACFNPLHVEGKMMIAEAEEEAEPLSKRKRSNLKLFIPPPQPQQQEEILPDQSEEETAQKQPSSLDTPAVEKALNVGEEGVFDLLEYVTNTELPVNDPGFLALISDTGSSPPSTSSVGGLATVDADAIGHVAPTKGKRKQAASKMAALAAAAEVQEPVATTTTASRSKSKRQTAAAASNSDHCYVGPSTSSHQPRPSISSSRRVSSNKDSSSAYSDDDIKEAKYRRMRDLNNLASKRCRQNRWGVSQKQNFLSDNFN